MNSVEIKYTVCRKVNNTPVPMFETVEYEDAREYMLQYKRVFIEDVFLIYKKETITSLVDWQEVEDEKSYVTKYEYTEQELGVVNNGMRRDV